MKFLKVLAIIGIFAFPCLAKAQCTPSNAPQGSIGCQPYLGPAQASDEILIWRSSLFPASTGTLDVSDILNYVEASFTYANLPALSANQVLGALTATTPSGLSVPSCSTANSSLQWTSGTGFSCYTNSASLAATQTFSGTNTFSAVITPTYPAGIAGIANGVTHNDGTIGEFVSASGSSISLTSGTMATIASVSLTAGDWQCWGNINYTPAGTTVPTVLTGAISLNNTMPSPPNNGGYSNLQATMPAGGAQTITVGQIREFSGAPATIYLLSNQTFSVSTMTGGGFLGCRRAS